MDQPTSIGHRPEGKWQFDGEVTHCFDDMLRRSIPQYEIMRRTVFDLACRYVRPGLDIVDLGCSRGEAMAPLVERFGGSNRFVGCDSSAPMLQECRTRFDEQIQAGVVGIMGCDLRHRYPPVLACVTLCVLTLQFTPIEYRQQIVKRIFDHTASAGCLILVEKVIGGTAETDRQFSDRYYEMKAENGYSHEDIDRKRMALEGVLVPVTARWNEQMLDAAGFSHIECFWRWMNFAGWLAVK
jgi:tRNA (cmo5U34)-methyltransferase